MRGSESSIAHLTTAEEEAQVTRIPSLSRFAPPAAASCASASIPLTVPAQGDRNAPRFDMIVCGLQPDELRDVPRLPEVLNPRAAYCSTESVDW
ncbi:hypothetical protein GUJ93_ZPchr0008g12983 [Zizania palustris]|uniref:Uncharacterized protein n=1 Tax=Zizania palustris TaxID=103762 RepID=A0A8J5RD92_ZIZPA|nr:hypothetical protein GUJ93_ZPchr0008g12983 [Zizania palustris]